jgi:exopolyphosphatase/guanosine-5'-triphosphate,3'-diphosphate pyrophosphatase
MEKTRLAAIDIGTNSIRCIVVDADRQGRFLVRDDEKATVRLGEGLDRSGVISPAACCRAMEAVGRMRGLIEGLGVVVVEAVATSAIRIAANGRDLADALSRELGHGIRVVSGQEEARLVALSGLRAFDMEGERHALIDIGGGSVEILIAAGQQIERCHSLDLGAVLMTERFLGADRVCAEEYQLFQQYVSSLLIKCFRGERIALQRMIVSGGCINSLGGMILNQRGQFYTSPHGHELLRSDVARQLSKLMSTGIRERCSIAGLNPERADIILAGCGVADELMRFFDASRLLINGRGMREGLIISCMRRLGLAPNDPLPRDWRSEVLEFARSCHIDEAHARHVARLALAVFDRLAGEGEVKQGERKVLEVAALLHDIGRVIAFDGHHKHSCHLIRHADLFGLTPTERELAALVARYQCKALPREKHRDFVRLSEQERDTVSRLGGILRLCDGLDRRGSGLVNVAALERDGECYRLVLQGKGDISVELHAANAKRDLFEKAFRASIDFTLS